jgi:hypothetical protein
MSHTAIANELKALLQDKLGPVEDVILQGTVEERPYAIILLGAPGQDRAATARITLSWAAGSKRNLIPLIYQLDEWKALDQRANGREWVGELSATPPGLEEHYRSHKAYPAPMRRFLLREISHYRAFVQQIQRSSELPVHLALSLSMPLAREAFSLLFSLNGRDFSGDGADFDFFVENHVSRGHFDSSHFQLLARLEGMATQAKLHSRYLGEREAEESLGWANLVGELRSFLQRFDTYVRVAYTSERELKRNRRLNAAGILLGISALVAAVSGYFIVTSPADPVSNGAALKKRAGGISGEYYKGRKFEKKIATRVDRNINIATHGKIHPKLPKDNASVRWKGFLYFPRAGAESLCISSDDGARLIFNEKKIAGEWTVHGERKSCSTVYVKEGWYPLQVDYFEKGGRALVRLKRGKDEDSARSIPSSHFCCKDEKLKHPPKKNAPKKAPRAGSRKGPKVVPKAAINPGKASRRRMPELVRAPARKKADPPKPAAASKTPAKKKAPKGPSKR